MVSKSPKWGYSVIPLIDGHSWLINGGYKLPAGWETARGGSMTSCKYLSTDLNTLTVVYACWENNLGPKSCYLQWGKILSNILVVNAILREGNILLEGLEFDFFFAFLLKT